MGRWVETDSAIVVSSIDVTGSRSETIPGTRIVEGLWPLYTQEVVNAVRSAMR